jgi:hypothetical protein
VLLIIGHTGCAAVEAANERSKKDKPEGALAEELAHIELPKDVEGAEAVAANVNAQVADAVGRFARHVQAGDLTVIGAVYDFKDELDDGHGRLSLINVNGNVEEERIDAFQKAVKESKGSEPAPPPGVKRPGNLANVSPGALSTDATSDARVRAMIERASRLLPESRATINAVNVLGAGGLDALENGVLKVNKVRPPAPHEPAGEHGATEHGHGRAESDKHEPAGHGAPAKSEHGAPAKSEHGAPAKAEKHEPPPAKAAPGKAAHDEPPATGQPGGTKSGNAPPLPSKPVIKPPKEEHKSEH